MIRPNGTTITQAELRALDARGAHVAQCVACGWLALLGVARLEGWTRTAPITCPWCRRRARARGETDPAQTEIQW